MTKLDLLPIHSQISLSGFSLSRAAKIENTLELLLVKGVTARLLPDDVSLTRDWVHSLSGEQQRQTAPMAVPAPPRERTPLQCRWQRASVKVLHTHTQCFIG